MSSVRAAFSGLGRVLGSPSLVLFLWLSNVVVAVPLALSMAASIQDSIGGSLVHQNLRDGLDMGWHGEFDARAKGIEKTFSPSIVGAGAFFDNIEAWLNGSLFETSPALLGLGAVYGLLWAFFLGGIFHRYADGRGLFRLPEFFSHGAEFFFRFVRLAVLSGLLYYLVYRFAGWLFGWIEDATRDVPFETTVLFYVIAASILVAFLLSFVNMAFDYAKIATYKENRRSMVLAAIKGFRLVLGTWAALSSCTTASASWVSFFSARTTLVAPGSGQASVSSVVFAFLVGQAFLVSKLVLRLTFYAGQMALYESPGSTAEAFVERSTSAVRSSSNPAGGIRTCFSRSAPPS